MEAFMPSEIGRLIYGYLFEQCGEGLAEQFLDTCDSMGECRLLKRRHAKNFHHRVQDLSLEDILGQYSVLCSLIFKNCVGGDEEPVHRNVLGLLRKLLGSRLGLSAGAARSGCLRKPSESQRNCAVGAQSPAAGDFGSDPVDVGLDGAPETAPPSEAEIAQDSASLERRERRICAIFDECAGDGRKRPFPSAQYCTPRKQNVGLVCGSKTPTSVMKSIENVGKNRSPAAGRNVTAPPIKSVERSSKKDAGCVEEAARQSETGCQKEKLVRRASRSTPSKSPSMEVPVCAVATSAANSSTVAAAGSTMAVAASSSTMATVADTSTMAAAASTSRITAPIEEPFKSLPVTSALETARPVASIRPTSAPVITVPSVSTGSTVATTASMPAETPVTVASTETPATIASAETIFGDLSFESDCSARLDQPASNPISDGELAVKEPLPEDQRTPGNVDTIFSPVVSPAASEVAVSPIPMSRRVGVSKVTPEMPAADSGDTAKVWSSTKDLPWDLKLRLYSDHDSTLTEVSKRKPKDLRSRKSKEVQKKRKHNDSVEDDPTVAKRFKSGTSTSRQQTVVPGSAEANKEVEPERAASRRHRRSTEGTLEVDKERLKKAKDGSESKATANIAKAATSMRDMIDLGDAAAEKAKAGKVEKVSFVEKRLHQLRKDQFVKVDVHELRKDPSIKADGGSARSSSKPKVPVEPTSSSKIAKAKKPIAGEVINLTEFARSKKKGERSEERGAAKKPKGEVVEKILPQKEPKLVPVKRKRSLSPGEIVSPELVCHESLERIASPDEMLVCHERLRRDTLRDDGVDLGASEMPGDQYQLSIGEKSNDIEDFSNEGDQDYDIVLELSPEYELYSRVSQCRED